MNRKRAWDTIYALLVCLVISVMSTVPSVTWGAEEPAGREATELTMEAVQVEGQRIENVNDVKREFARRPGSNILIEEKQITESRALNLQDVLQFAPGVRFQSRFGAEEGQFSIRGTSLRNNFHHRGINILINGIYFGDADGFSDFESIDLLAYERIEVYKGANALRYGANTIGGAINFVPRTGYSASSLQMRAEGGSYGMYLGQVSSGKVLPFKMGSTDATADYYVSVTGNHQDGFQDNSQQSRQRINANVGLQLGNHQEIRAYFLQSNVSERIPGSLTNAQLLPIPTRREDKPSRGHLRSLPVCRITRRASGDATITSSASDSPITTSLPPTRCLRSSPTFRTSMSTIQFFRPFGKTIPMSVASSATSTQTNCSDSITPSWLDFNPATGISIRPGL